MNKYLIIAIVVLSLSLAGVFSLWKSEKAIAERQTSNVANLTKDNKELILTADDYRAIHTRDTEKLDSVLKIKNTKIKQVKSATITNTIYKDTAITKIVYKEAVQKPDKSYSIPIGFDSACWGFKGHILSMDPKSRIEITEKTTSNSTQLVVTKPKYFLGFLWRVRKGAYNAYSDCGEITFTDIQFVKK